MLAQNFKTPAELGLDEKAYRAAITVLGMLERGEIPAHRFDMMFVGKPECGTPGCFYGWMRSVEPSLPRLQDTIKSAPNTKNLFVPRLTLAMLNNPKDLSNPFDATPAQAAVALRSFLTTGDPNWDEAMRTA